MSTHKPKMAYLTLWGLGALSAFALQFFFPTMIAEGTIWGLATGWQREIALWNLGIIFVIAITVFKKEYAMIFMMTLFVTLLSLLFGINHLVALLASSQNWVHWLAFVANSIAFLVGIILLYVGREKSNIT